MKKILAIGLFVTSFIMNSYAQDPPAATRQETRKEAHKKMMADLNLTSDQENQLKAANKNFKDKAKGVKDNQSLSKQEKRQQLAALSKERNDKMSAFLTPEQQAKMKEDRKTGRKKKA